MKNRTKKIVFFAGLLAFGFGKNFCMQNNGEVIKSPDGKWEVRIIDNAIQNWSPYKERTAQVIKTENGETVAKYPLACKYSLEKLVMFSPDGKHVGFKVDDDESKIYFGKLIVLDLENLDSENNGEIIPFYQEGDTPTLQHFRFSANSKYIAAKIDSDGVKVFDLENKNDITRELKKNKATQGFMFSPCSKCILLTYISCIYVYSLKLKKKFGRINGMSSSNQRNLNEKYNIKLKMSNKFIAYYKKELSSYKINQKKIEILDLATGSKHLFEFDKIVEHYDFLSDDLLKVKLENGAKPLIVDCCKKSISNMILGKK